MLRLIPVLLLTAPLATGEPIRATNVTIEDYPRTLVETMDFLKKQSGIAIDVSKVDGGKKFVTPRESPQPFWQALDKIAGQGGCHVVFRDHGKSIALAPGVLKSPVSIDGPFRIVARSANSRLDYQTEARMDEITLDLHWEPRFPVFRVSSQPTITSAVDERGNQIPVASRSIKSAIGDRYAFNSTVRLDGLTHGTTNLKSLEGYFTVTAAPKMLTFTFKAPASETKDNVAVSLMKLAATEGRIDVEFKLDYPEAHPEFESFESWTDFNKLRIISADRTKTWTPENFSMTGSGRRIAAEYRFAKLTAADIAGASIVYETPAPLVEFPVNFKLKDISLP